MTKDVLIIGSGAGGGSLALALSRAGFSVLVLEKGPRYARADYRHDEILMADQFGFFLPKISEDPHVLVKRNGTDSTPELTTMGWIASCVGGGTAHMGGSFYRFHPEDFRMRSRFGDYCSLADWPYTYEDLEPYYSRAEWEIGVSGSTGSNPFEGTRSRPLPLPPVDAHPMASFFDQACERLRLHAFPTPSAVNSRPYQGRPSCAYCDFCAGYGCPVGARGSSQEALLSKAERTGRCEIRSRTMVREVTVGSDGRVRGCLYIDEAGAEHEVRARIVCVCCSAVESARLLLMSRSPRFPDGLANGNGLVGRNLQFHGSSMGRARFRDASHPEKQLRNRNPFLGRSVADFYFLPEGVSDLAKGGVLRFGLSQPSPVAVAQRLACEDPGPPLWGERLKRRLREYYQEQKEICFEVFHDFIPNENTFVELDPAVRDRWGLPAARIYLGPPEHHQRAGQWLVERGLEILDEMGADRLAAGSIGGTSRALVHGTCRAGRDPATSVLNEFCQAHEVPNLFVVDGSFMPTSGGAAPTLTIVANGFRTADHIVERARRGDFG
jgi:choline dehydrogenase-like flavoprotein